MIPTDKNSALVAELTTAARRAYGRGMQTGSGGNLSARVPGEERMIISGSGSSFADCEASGKGWVVTDFGGTQKGEDGVAPSKESRLHGYLYQQLPEVMSIVHCHSAWAIAWANAAEELPFVSWQSVLKLRYPLQIFGQGQSAVSAEECETIGAALKKTPGATCFLLREHGLVAMGGSPLAAEHQAEFVEECAKIAILKRLIGAPLFTGEA